MDTLEQLRKPEIPTWSACLEAAEKGRLNLPSGRRAKSSLCSSIRWVLATILENNACIRNTGGVNFAASVVRTPGGMPAPGFAAEVSTPALEGSVTASNPVERTANKEMAGERFTTPRELDRIAVC